MDFSNLSDKAREFAKDHPDQVDTGIDKARDLADDRLDEKYDKHLDTGEQQARDRLGVPDNDQPA